MIDKVWSDYSIALFDKWTNTSDNLIVQACPGAGKTTNIEHICRNLIPQNQHTAYLAFGKDMVAEAKTRLPEYMKRDILTLNGLGHRAIYSYFGRVKMDMDDKVSKVFRLALKEVKQGRTETRLSYMERVSNAAKAVGLMKINLDVEDNESFVDICSMYDIDTYPNMYNECMRTLKASDEETKCIDYNDQLRFPIIYNLPMPQYDNVLVDETQDLSTIQRMLLSMIHARFAFVGDKRQGMYVFRGAMLNAMDEIKSEFNCVELPLKLTYRCSKAVVNEARKLFDDIEALDTAIDGEMSVSNGQAEMMNLTSRDMVMCRLNAPLLSYAYALLRAGIPCHVMGRDIGQGLIKLVDKLQCHTVGQCLDALGIWRDAEIYKAEQRGNEQKKQSIMDKADSLEIFARQCNVSEPVSTLKDKIAALLNDKGSGVKLSTVHKAKGLEADNAYILCHDLMPLQWAKKPWEQEQEKNIEYVAVTRAKNKITYM